MEVGVGDALQVEEGVLVRVLLQHGPKEGRAGAKDQLVRLDLLVAHRERQVEEVRLFAKLAKGFAEVRFEVVPAQAKSFQRRHAVCTATMSPSETWRINRNRRNVKFLFSDLVV